MVIMRVQKKKLLLMCNGQVRFTMGLQGESDP